MYQMTSVRIGQNGEEVIVTPPPNANPLISLEADKSVTAPTTFTATASDPDGTIISYLWTQIDGPNTATLSNETTATVSISGMLVGIYRFRCTVMDDDGATSFAEGSITYGTVPLPEVISFSLTDLTGNEILNITGNTTIDLGIYVYPFALRANIGGVSAGSVVFSGGTLSRTENTAPYTGNGDSGGSYSPFSPTPVDGSIFTITATPYTLSGGGGSAGTALTVILTFEQTVAVSADMWIAPTGNSGNPGTEISPKNIGSVSILTAGQKALIKGGSYPQSTAGQGQITFNNSGTESDPITIENAPGEVPELSSSRSLSNNTSIYVINKSYITVRGIKLNGGGLDTASSIKNWAILNGCDHLHFDQCIFLDAEGWSGFDIQGVSSYLKITNCYFDRCGAWNKNLPQSEWDAGVDTGVDKADSMTIGNGTQYVLIEGNTFKRGGHNLYSFEGKYIIIKGNTFDNNWGLDKNGYPIGQRHGEVRKEGRYILFEGNSFWNSHKATDNNNNPTVKVEGQNVIFRHNVLALTETTYNNQNRGVSSTNNLGIAKNLVVYNNTLSGCGRAAYHAEMNGSDYDWGNVIYLNNIAHEYAKNAPNSSTSVAFFISMIDNSFGGCEVKNNLYYSANGIKHMYVKGQGNRQLLTWFEANHPTNVSNNIDADPLFQLSTRGMNYYDYALSASSPCRNTSRYLTLANGSGSSSSELTVDDARFFMGSIGWDIYAGDMIDIGGVSAKILNIDYGLNKLYLETPISWSDNSQIHLKQNGIKVSHIGAVQS